jgi:hypothetical protein
MVVGFAAYFYHLVVTHLVAKSYFESGNTIAVEKFYIPVVEYKLYIARGVDVTVEVDVGIFKLICCANVGLGN